MNINITNITQTKSLAEKIAALTKNGDVITLEGDLGAGKTAFAGFFINSMLDQPQNILSPTFNIVHPYQTKKFTIYHFDLYRIDDISEIANIGLYDAFDNGVSLIEWPQIIGDILPKDRLLIKLSSGDVRTAEIEGFGDWKDRTKLL
jgi:tRNA threonylcarbamoyl adenosine modification protein YjeE